MSFRFANFLPTLITPLVLCLLAGCATTQSTSSTALAPWTGIMSRSKSDRLAAAGPTRQDPQRLLADGDVWIPRGTRYVDGPLTLSSVSAYSVYTYDVEPISLPGGSGYQYRSVVQSGVLVP